MLYTIENIQIAGMIVEITARQKIVWENFMGYLYLFLAIVGELIGGNLLKASNGFSNWISGIGALIAYNLCFYSFSLSLKTLQLNVAYGLWAGIGIVCTLILSVVLWKESVNIFNVIGILLILLGSLILNFLGTSTH